MTFRAFIAVEVPTSHALEAFSADLRNASRALKVVATDRLHLTLKFLGETEEGLVPEIRTAMAEAVADLRPFEIRVQGTGAFPSLSRMNVIWVGVEGAEPLATVVDALEGSTEPMGFPRETRKWTAHVTLARVKGHRDLDRARQVVEAYAGDAFGVHRVDAVHLKKSVLTPQGALYSIVETVPLSKE